MMVPHDPHQKILPRSLFLFSQNDRIRATCLRIVRWRFFDFLILCIIFANCVALAVHKPYPNGDSDYTNDILDKLEYFFVGVFTLECVSKIVAWGFVLHNGAYLRNGLNVMDFFIVLMGLISIVAHWTVPSRYESALFDVNALRAFRVLRPLRVLSGIPSLQVVLNAVVHSLVPLMHVAILVFLMMLTYAIVGVELFMGALHQACYVNKSDTLSLVEEPTACGGMEHVCSSDLGEVCAPGWEGPNRGITSFDNVALAMLTVFQCLTMEGWTDVMYEIQNAVGNKWPWIYFVSLIVVGAFFLMNLVLGVLSGMFSKEKQKAEKKRTMAMTAGGKKLDEYMREYIHRIASRKKRRPDVQVDPVQEDMQALRHDFLVVGWRDTLTYKQLVKSWQNTRLNAFRIVKSQAFYWIVLTMVFLNTCLLATEYYGQPVWLTEFQDRANIAFVAFFVVETFIRIFALGVHQYFSSHLNRFEFVVISISVLECILNQLGILPDLGLSVLRAARLVRIFKITTHWTNLRNVMRSIVNSLRSILSLLFLLFLFLFVFAILGMQLFGGRFNFTDEELSYRSTFDSFWQASLTVFQILTGEDWPSVMFHGIRAYGGIHSVGALSCIYFLVVIIGGKYILLNIFLAIAVDNLDEAVQLPKHDEPNTRGAAGETGAEGLEDAVLDTETRECNATTWNGHEDSVKRPEGASDHRDRCWSSPVRLRSKSFGNQLGMQRDRPSTSLPVRLNLLEKSMTHITAHDRDPQEQESLVDDHRISGIFRIQQSRTASVAVRYRSLFLFDPQNRFRQLCLKISNDHIFRAFILVCILVSSAMLAAVDPVSPTQSTLDMVLDYLDYFFTALFAMELLLKIVAYGLVMHPGSFCRSLFNLLDLLVVVLSVVSYAFNGSDFTAVKALRVFRVFRPLIAINRAKGLRRIVRCVALAIRSIWNVILVILITQLMFAVIGVQLFKGRFYHCTDPSKITAYDCQGTFIEYKDDKPLSEPSVREWVDNPFNFDNVAEAMLLLLAVVSTEGWPSFSSYAYAAVDSTWEGHGPVLNYRPYAAIYFVVYLSIVGFFMLNVFVGFIIITFQKEGEEEFVDCQLDENQRKCVQFALEAKPRTKYIPKNRIQHGVWSFVTSEPFESCIFGLIILNTLAMSIRYEGQPRIHVRAFEYLNMIFTTIFCLECLLKLYAFKFVHYFRDIWNVFDFIVVILSVVDIGYALATGVALEYAWGLSTLRIILRVMQTVTEVNVFRIFRAFRLVKILGKNENTRILLWTFVKSLQSLPYVALFIAVVFFIYGVIGMHYLKCDRLVLHLESWNEILSRTCVPSWFIYRLLLPCGTLMAVFQLFRSVFGKISLVNADSFITHNNNFQSFPQALLLLFRSATGESWQDIMMSCANRDGVFCAAESGALPGTLCGSDFSYLYFTSFHFLCAFMILNVVVAIILDNFDYLTRDASIAGPQHLDEFVRLWAEYDPKGCGYINLADLTALLRSIFPPLGVGRLCPDRLVRKRLMAMNMPLNSDGMVQFNATLLALIRTGLGIYIRGTIVECDTKMRTVIKQVWKKTPKSLLDLMVPRPPSTGQTVGMVCAAAMILARRRKPPEEVISEPLQNLRMNQITEIFVNEDAATANLMV